MVALVVFLSFCYKYNFSFSGAKNYYNVGISCCMDIMHDLLFICVWILRADSAYCLLLVFWVYKIVVLMFGYLFSQEIQIDELITHNIPFKDINQAFDLMVEGKCLRCVISMPK